VSRFSSTTEQKAKKKPVEKTNPGSLGVDVTPRIKVLSVEDPPTRQAGIKVDDVDSLLAKLKEKALI
jgi:electron transfer flavoprotein beta subunit